MSLLYVWIRRLGYCEKHYLLNGERLFGFADDMALNLYRLSRLIEILFLFMWFGEFPNLQLHRSKTVWLIAGYPFSRDLQRGG